MSAQIISYDKINQLRHVQYFQTPENILSHMDRLAQELRPKFDLVLSKLKSQLGGTGLATWSTPKGGYFISLYTPSGCARDGGACQGSGSHSDGIRGNLSLREG